MIPDAKKLVEILAEHHLKIATAESCTGGLVAAAITDVSGSSGVYDMGVVSYANRIKEDVLAVPGEVLAQYGAVSSQTAMAMAKGICNAAKAHIGISTTGIAGPGGGTPEKPVGTVYIGICVPGLGICVEEKLQLQGDRAAVRRQTVETLLARVLRMISENPGILSLPDETCPAR